jgi:uncharacterized membrane protein HdeD (DUF308 family)
MSQLKLAARDVKVSGSVLIVSGVITLIVALAAIFWPDETLLVLAILAGLNLFILGIVAIVEAVTGGTEGSRVLSAVLGVLAIVAGVVLIRRPSQSLLVFVVILGAWFVISAVVAFVRGIFEAEGRGVRLVVAFVEFVFGVLILSLPNLSLKTLAVLAGIAFGIRGVGLIATGLEMHKAGKAADKDLTAADGPTPATV